MATKLLFIQALTSIHAGTGQGVGTIDLPIARERATNLPVIPGSTLKGCLRAASTLPAESKSSIFGTGDRQGKLRVSDARLILLPVRCPGSTFVWATSPYVLRRFQRDCLLVAGTNAPEIIPNPNDLTAHLKDKTSGIEINGKPRLVLEDLDFEIREGESKLWGEWISKRLYADADAAWRPEFEKRFAVLSDTNLDYLCEFATEVNAHISIGESGTVEHGALWYEESLPAETVLVALVDFGNAEDAGVIPSLLRVGGNETTGQGLARLVLAGGAA
jgi:CRISPR-associated protein Cmr4